MISSAGRRRPIRSAMVAPRWRALMQGVRLRRQRAETRSRLAAMTDRELQDCGITRAEIEHELYRPR